MLKIIGPNGQKFHQSTIGAFLDLLKVYQNFELSLEIAEKATFLIAEDERYGVYGGAVLYPQKIPSHLDLEETDRNEETIIKLTSTFQVEGKEYWTARICLCLESGASVAKILETQDLCHHFSNNLYQAFIQFGEEQGIDYLAYTFRVPETYNLKTFERWPYQLGVAVADPDHDFGHGILFLKGNAFKARQYDKSWRQV